jgi:hypothetical protein
MFTAHAGDQPGTPTGPTWRLSIAVALRRSPMLLHPRIAGR